MVKFKDFSRPLSVIQILFKANFNFQDSPVYSSTFQACANPGKKSLPPSKPVCPYINHAELKSSNCLENWQYFVIKLHTKLYENVSTRLFH